EVVGLRGFAGDNYVIVETKEQWERLPKMKKAGVVSQSTQPPWAFKELVAHVAEISQELKVVNTVCPVTVTRQHAATELSRERDGGSVRAVNPVGRRSIACPQGPAGHDAGPRVDDARMERARPRAGRHRGPGRSARGADGGRGPRPGRAGYRRGPRRSVR